MKFFLLVLLSVFQIQAATVEEAFKAVNLSNDSLAGATVIKSLQRKGSVKTFTTIKLQKAKEIYEMEFVSPVTQTEFEKDQKNSIGIILLSYSDQPTPYAGEITNTAKCSEHFKPKMKKDFVAGSRKITLIESFIDKDFNYGVCEMSLKKHKACTSYSYNEPTKQSLKLKIIGDPSSNCESLSTAFYKNLKAL